MTKSIVAVVGLALASVASADLIDVQYVYVEAGGTLSGVLNGHDYTDARSADGMQFMHTANPVGALAAQIPANAWVACRELGQSTDFAFRTYNVDTLDNAISAPKAALVRQLWQLHYNHAWQSNTPIYTNQFFGGEPANTAENAESLAFIYSIYAIRYNFDGTAGSLTVSNNALPFYMYAETNPATISLANSWLGGLDLNYAGPVPYLLDMSNETYQDLIVEVPAPGAIALMGMGGLLAARRRR